VELAVDVSIVVATRNRSKRLGPFLDAIAKIDHPGPWEVVLVDNASTDDTFDVLSAFAAKRPQSVRVLQVGAGGKTVALNAGILEAKGQVLAFTDDDCYVDPGYVSAIWHAFKDPEIGFITGRILLHDPTDAPVTIELATDIRAFKPRMFMNLLDGRIHGANMAIRRSAVIDAGSFDPVLGPGARFSAAEDVDMLARVNLLGWAGRYEPSVVVSHHHGRKMADLPPVFEAYSRGRGAYHMKLLVRLGRPRWFLAASWARLKQIVRHPKAVIREFASSAEYLWFHLRSRG
jgi:glycosyltransferase involved in cell wall biosynthesis